MEDLEVPDHLIVFSTDTLLKRANGHSKQATYAFIKGKYTLYIKALKELGDCKGRPGWLSDTQKWKSCLKPFNMLSISFLLAYEIQHRPRQRTSGQSNDPRSSIFYLYFDTSFIYTLCYDTVIWEFVYLDIVVLMC